MHESRPTGTFGFPTTCPDLRRNEVKGLGFAKLQDHVLARMIFFNHPRPCTFRCSWLGCVPFRLPKAICLMMGM